MNGRANHQDNAVAESLLQLLKREGIKRKVYNTREEPKSDVFNSIEVFYIPAMRHSNIGLSPPKFEKKYFYRRASI